MGTNTSIGIGIGIPFKNNALGGDRPYLPPELKARLIGVWDNYGKKNTDADRNIIKNKIPNAGGDLEILNSAYRLNSGFGGYSNDFQEYTYSENVVVKDNTNAIFNSRGKLLVPYSYLTKDIPSFKIKVSGLSNTYHFRYYYRDSNGVQHSVDMAKDGNYELPICYNVQSSSDGTSCGFTNYGSDIVSVEILPEYEGAFVTDGVNDMIVSQNTVEEMGITDEVTVVSMIHQIDLNSTYTIATTNYIENSNSREHVRSDVYNYGKTGIYGYSASLINNTKSDIKNILGDEADYYVKSTNSLQTIFDAKFSVVGRISELTEASQVAWYWTIIANKVLTTDQINQVIAYFNLDRTLKPDILCDVKKQGITNDNHAEFGDKLIDFSGNGRDIQLNNIAWDGDSSIGKYNYPNWKVNVTRGNKYARIVYYDSINGTYSADFKGITDLYKSYGLSVEIRVNRANTIDYHSIKEDSIYTVTPPDDTTSIDIRFGGENVYNASCDITISQIPSHAGALCLDGVNDFGKVTGMPIYKDYTVVTDREIFANIGAISSKNNPGAFVETAGNSVYSFGQATSGLNFISTRSISYLSKYSYCGQSITAGAAEDSTDMWLGTIRDNDSRFFNGAIYSLMTFPYSMSEFLIERQLKKHKLGTLYPDMVEFRPVIKTNVDYTLIQFYINNYTKHIYPGDYIPINTPIEVNFYLKNNVDELISFKVNGNDSTFKRSTVADNAYNIRTLPITKSPQKINITIDEYIGYEDIVQPYPALLRFNDENDNEVSWGGKFKVGSTITRIGSAADSNLLPNIYNIFGLLLNGNQVTSSKVIVEKTMVFKAKSAYIFDNNEPKCILSPRLLRIPNSSYKILGYIPDISGHGNHGVIYNSAYAEGSGVNEDGSYQFDGVDDFVTIPTLSKGGKQVLMKVNWSTLNGFIYDQRPASGDKTFGIYTQGDVIAYSQNNNGNTYIDGIINNNIIGSNLSKITHNIVVTCDVDNSITPSIGKSSYSNSYFAQMSLYDFMLFDNISTDDKIKQLNEYVGIEAKVELPPYYWDAYGKTNLDADKATIQQRGVAVGDYDLTNTNFAYDKMSGFGGYEFEKFTDTTKWIETKREDGIEVIEKNDYSFTAKKVGTGQYFWDFKNNSIKTLDRDLTVKAISNNNVYIRWEFKYRTAKKPDIDSTIILLRQAMTPNVPITVTLPYKTQEEQTELGVVEGSTYYLFYFDPSDIPVGDEYTVEMLPLYPNGLVYDGVDDYSKNKNIPILTDFTFIIKREILGLETNESMLVIKGDKIYNNGIGNAFILEHNNNNGVNYVYSYGKLNQIERDDSKIIYLTPESYNGNPIIKGKNGDNLALILSRHWKGIIYKTILYSKTISLLEINFLKNLMEKDEIIDLNNPIFIKNE